jgi:hypothetical protein
MLLLAALALAAAAPQHSGPVVQATASVRVISGSVLHFGQAHHEQGARMRDATVRSTDGTVQTARLVEFE